MPRFLLQLSGLFLILGSLTAGAQSSTQIPYYGKELYQGLKSGAKDEELKQLIVTVLRSGHLLHDGQLDEIVPNCSGENCSMHISIGYTAARTFLFGKFYLHKHGTHYAVEDLYCNKDRDEDEFSSRKPGPSVIPSETVMNTEHTWPQSKFNSSFSDDMQKSDMHHLFPTDSQMNALRGNGPFGEVVNEKQALKCPDSHFGTTRQGTQVFEPPPGHRGHVARALFYFALKYGMKINPEQEASLRKWHHEHPVDAEELQRNDVIYGLQGSRNPFIDHPEMADLISDF